MVRLIRQGFAFIKFPYHITFINVVFGAFMFAPTIDVSLTQRLAALYVSFNVLLYTGLYTINDLADRDADARHPLKRNRPIASGRISVPAARRWAAVFLVAGVVSGLFLIGPVIVGWYGAIVALNLLYSGGGRNVLYLDAVLNGLPHVARFGMGAALVGRWPPATHFVALGCLATALSALRRRVELDVEGWQARRTLQDWSLPKLNGVVAGSLAAMLLLTLWRWRAAPGFYAALVGTAVVLVGGGYRSIWIRRALRRVWTC